METLRKIAVVRANGIGDYCFSVPALLSLRAAFPHAEIVLLGKRWHRDFLANRPGPIDRCIAIPPYGGVSAEPGTPENSEEIEEFFNSMRAERFDLALQMHGGGRYSNPFTLRLGARTTAGMRAPDAVALDRSIPYVYFQPEVLRYLEVVSLVGVKPCAIEPVVSLVASDVAEAESLDLPNDKPLAIIHPGATDPRRRWSPENFSAVGNAVARAGAHVAVIGTGDERSLVQRIVQHMNGAALDLCDQLTLGGLAALLARSQVVVSNDSGPLHLAGAVGAKTVGIFWCGNLINGGPVSRARHHPVISWQLDCPLCRRNTLFDDCGHKVSFVDSIKVADVATAALDLLQTKRGRAAIAA